MSGRIKVCPAEERTMDNIVFASGKEMHRYMELKILLRAGYIRDLELQPKYPIVVNNEYVCTYIADFKYTDKDDRLHIEDAKGGAYRTEMYKLKSKLFHACFPMLRIEEV